MFSSDIFLAQQVVKFHASTGGTALYKAGGKAFQFLEQCATINEMVSLLKLLAITGNPLGDLCAWLFLVGVPFS